MVSCTTDTPSNDLAKSLEKLVVTTTDEQILDSVAGLKEATDTLSASAIRFCKDPTEAKLIVSQDAWKATSLQWHRAALFNFGPLENDVVFPRYTFFDSFRLRGTNYLETVRVRTREQLEDTVTLNADYYLMQTFQKVGLLALEVLLFETADESSSQVFGDIVTDFQRYDGRKCDALKGQASVLAQRANDVLLDWRDGEGDDLPFAEYLSTNLLPSGAGHTSQLLISAQEYIDYLHARRVVSVTASLSKYAWENVRSALDQLEDFLQGAQSNTGFLPVMTSTGYTEEVALVEANLKAAFDAVTDQDATALELALAALDGNIKREIPDSLLIVLGINFTDGD